MINESDILVQLIQWSISNDFVEPKIQPSKCHHMECNNIIIFQKIYTFLS